MKVLKTTLSKAFPLVILLALSLCSDPETPRPEIISISPAQGSAGTVTTFTGRNFASVENILFGSTATYPISKTDTEMTAVVPDGLTTGELGITVKSEGGVSNPFDFKVLPGQPEITSISPARAGTGMTVTLMGKFLNAATIVEFDDKAVTSFESKTDTELGVVVPVGLLPGKVNVSVTSEGGESSYYIINIVGNPKIGSFTPNHGSAGKVVNISGSYFDDASIVYFDTAKAEFKVQSEALIQATVPVRARTGRIRVVTPGGTVSSISDFTIHVGPSIRTFSPASGTTGTVVTVEGSGFERGDVSVKFGDGQSSEVVVLDANRLTARVPADASSGKIRLETTTGVAMSESDFTCYGVPAISTFMPTSGGVGTAVTIRGSNFSGATVVRFNNASVPADGFKIVSASEINVNVPAGTTTGKLSITTPGGTGTTNENFNFVFAPTLTAFSPRIGSTGARIAISGSNFLNTTKVLFGVGEAPFEVKSATLIEATVPNDATTGRIRVLSTGGETVSDSDFTVKEAPEVTGFIPATGMTGTTVIIDGQNLDAKPVQVRFGEGMTTDITVISRTQISVKVPATASSGKITVETATGSAISTDIFTVIGAPTVNSFTPTAGVGNTSVIVHGTNFINVTSIRFNEIMVSAGNYTVVSNTEIKATVPVSATTGKISVTTAAATGISVVNFIVYQAPTIGAFTPNLGASGREVKITGTNFDGATSVMFGGVEAVFGVESATLIRAVVPPGASTGKITISTPIGTATSTSDFNIVFLPIVYAFSPASGPAGSTVTIEGAGFTGITSVKFNGIEAGLSNIMVNSSSSISVTIPDGATSGKISVSNLQGTGSSNNAFYVSPFISDISPSSGDVDITVITITGTNLEGSTVQFGGLNAIPLTNTSTKITVAVPAGVSGTVNVSVVNAAGGSNAKEFTVTAP